MILNVTIAAMIHLTQDHQRVEGIPIGQFVKIEKNLRISHSQLADSNRCFYRFLSLYLFYFLELLFFTYINAFFGH